LHKDGTRNDTVERFFAEELDDYLPRWIEGFERSFETGGDMFSNHDSRNRFVQFFYNHVKRTPDFVEPIIEKVAEDTFSTKTLERFEREFRPLTTEEKSRFFSDEFREATVSNSRVANFSRQSDVVLERLWRMKIVLGRPQRKTKSFVVGSNPVVRFESFPRQELGEEGVELWTSLTPKLAIGFVNASATNTLLTLPDQAVRKFNGEITRKSRAIGSPQKRLLESLTAAFW
jgi:hypothetical protein